jgi:hypothetical protein
MDPPNVLWFAGAYALAAGSYVLLGALPESHSSVWIFVAGLAFLLVYSAASHGLLRQRWWVPGGLAAALAVAMVPAVAIGFLRLIHVWSNDLPVSHFNGYAVGVAIATAVAGLIAYLLTRFTFLYFTVVTAILVRSQFLAEAGGSPTGEDRATAALITGGLMLVVGVFLTLSGVDVTRSGSTRSVGSVPPGSRLSHVEPGGNPERGWIRCSSSDGDSDPRRSNPPLNRAVYGVLGYYAPLLLMVTNLNENGWVFAVALLAVVSASSSSAW